MSEPISWGGLREALKVPTLGSRSRSRLGTWIVDELERQLGRDWPTRAERAGAVGGMLEIQYSNPAFFRLLTLALRLATAGSLPGRRAVINSLRRDFSAGSRLRRVAAARGRGARAGDRLAGEL